LQRSANQFNFDKYFQLLVDRFWAPELQFESAGATAFYLNLLKDRRTPMSLEQAINDHTAALLVLAEAIRTAGGGTVNVVATAGKTDKPAATTVKTTPKEEEQEEGTIFWADNKAGTVGKVASQAEYDKLKKKNPNLTKTTETGYNKKLKDAKAKAEAEKAKGGGGEEPTVEDLANAFGAFLPKDLEGDVRDERRAFAKEIIARFGGPKITDMPEEHYALAINLVKRKMAGHEFDVEDAEFEEIDEDEVEI
jgi:hypothetical protein